MLQDRVALHALEYFRGERELLRIRCHIDVRHRKEVNVHISRNAAARAPDVKVPTPKRKILRLPRIHHQGSRWVEQAPQKSACFARSVAVLQVGRVHAEVTWARAEP